MKTAVITGGNSGVGKATATQLAKQGFRVIIHGRDRRKTAEAAEEIKKLSGNTHVENIVADVSSLNGMKELAVAIKQKTDTINALVLSTGVILTKYILTPDGLEAGFAIQYLSRFALTRYLMPELEKGSARIVLVVAPVIPGAKIWLEDIALKKNFTVLRALKQEMFANHLFVQEFAKRYPGNRVVMNCANVGFAKTSIVRNMPFFLRFIYRLFAKPPEFAARNFAFLAGEQINFSGYFLKKAGHPELKKKITYDGRTAEKLWAISAELTQTKAENDPVLR